MIAEYIVKYRLTDKYVVKYLVKYNLIMHDDNEVTKLKVYLQNTVFRFCIVAELYDHM